MNAADLARIELLGLGCLMVVLCIHWRIARRRGVTPWTVRGADAKELIAQGLLLIIMLIFSASAMIRAFGVCTWLVRLHRPVIGSEIPVVAGVGVMALTLMMLSLSMSSMGRSWRIGIPSSSSAALVTSGLFAWSRNPIFLSLYLFGISVVLVERSWPALTLLALLVVILHVQIMREERALLAVHGAAYRSYCSVTPRYISLRRRRALHQQTRDRQ